MIVKKSLNYQDKNVALKGMVAFDDAINIKRPLVLVCHDWSGCNDFAKEKAESLAKLGYVGFALDMFGDGKIFTNNEEKMAAIQPFVNDRQLLAERINTALNFAKTLEFVDPDKVAAIGFCFGGMCVLDLARSGAKINGVISFHGLLGAPPFKDQKINAKILALHGHEDPMVKPDLVRAFETEMTAANADWQIHVYGKVEHAFTNPDAHDAKLGLMYNALAAKRSWQAMQNFLSDIF